MARNTKEKETATIQVSQRTKAAIELYRRGYLFFGNMLELRDELISDDRMETEANDLEKMGNELTELLEHIVGYSTILDQEKELESVKLDLLYDAKE